MKKSKDIPVDFYGKHYKNDLKKHVVLQSGFVKILIEVKSI